MMDEVYLAEVNLVIPFSFVKEKFAAKSFPTFPAGAKLSRKRGQLDCSEYLSGRLEKILLHLPGPLQI